MKNATSSTWFKSFSTDLNNKNIIQEGKPSYTFSNQKDVPQELFTAKQTLVEQDSFQEKSIPVYPIKNTHSDNDQNIHSSSVRVDQPETAKESNLSSELHTSREAQLLSNGGKKLLPRKTRKANNFSSININELKKTPPVTQDIEQVLENKVVIDEEKTVLPAENEDNIIEKNEFESQEWKNKRDEAACKIQAWWKGTLTRIFLTGALVERRLRCDHQGKNLGIKTRADPYGHFVFLNDSYSTKKLSLKADSIKPWPRSHVALLCDFLDTLKVTNKSFKPSCTIQGVYANKLKESYGLEAGRQVVDIVKQLQISESQRKEIELLWELNNDVNVDDLK